jgi:hypothetical protein
MIRSTLVPCPRCGGEQYEEVLPYAIHQICPACQWRAAAADTVAFLRAAADKRRDRRDRHRATHGLDERHRPSPAEEALREVADTIERMTQEKSP